MKKNLKMVMAASFAILSTMPSFTTRQKVIENLAADVSQKRLDYVWYNDEDMTDPTGSICAINQEVNRLQTLFPGNVFTTVFSSGLHGYEWGYNSLVYTVVIYSDR